MSFNTRIVGPLVATLLAVPASASPGATSCQQYDPKPVLIPLNAQYLTRDGRIRIVGYNDMAEMLVPMTEHFTQLHPGVRFELVLKGTRTGPPALTDGSSLLAPMGAEWEEPAFAAYRARYGSEPAKFRIAHGSLNPKALSSPSGIFVHHSNPVRMLTTVQVRRIFTGSTSDWSGLGAHGLGSIHPVGLSENLAIGQFFKTRHFNNQTFAKSFVGKRRSREVIEAIANDPSAIGFANLNHVDPRVRVVGILRPSERDASFGSRVEIHTGRYPYDRHLLVYVRRDTQGRLEPIADEWLKFVLSCEGQSIIERGELGYIPLSAKDQAVERAKLNPFVSHLPRHPRTVERKLRDRNR